MSLLKMAGEIFMAQLGGQGEGLNLDSVMKGLQQLLPTEGGVPLWWPSSPVKVVAWRLWHPAGWAMAAIRVFPRPIF